MTDNNVHDRIQDLIDQEHSLRDQLGKGEISRAEENEQLKSIETQLDQCWDLLRQRRAKREFGEDPRNADVRPASTVEGYTN